VDRYECVAQWVLWEEDINPTRSGNEKQFSGSPKIAFINVLKYIIGLQHHQTVQTRI
jgi:hypothetical protein